jgi:GTP-binding protein
LHEKYREFGGPDGGDGGIGGDVIFRADDNQNTLYYYKTHHKMVAENGERGKKRKCHGKNGLHLYLNVPRGTIVTDADTGEIIADLSDQNEVVAAKGGEGGFGNSHFTTSTRQAPRVAEIGVPGESKNITLEMKLVADVGLVGLPNVGKSTLLSVISSAKPKIADYEFTTIIPNLGVVEGKKFGVESGFVVADIPGLIEGASEGRGLGDDFLRHIERTRVLVHLVDATHPDPANDYKTIKKELKDYKVNLANRPEVVALNKTELVGEPEVKKIVKKLQKVIGESKLVVISAATHSNLAALMHEIEKLLAAIPKETPAIEPDFKVFTVEDVVNEKMFSVEKVEDFFEVKGKKIEKFAQKTDPNNQHALARIRDIINKMGIEKELTRKGAKKGSTLIIAGKKFIL